jgi:transposase
MDRMSPELWSRIPPEAQAIFLEMAETIARLERRVAELEARLGQSPRNSSLPPSSEHPHAKPVQPRPKSKRRRGGQPGHPKAERALIPTEQCTAVVVRKPRACRRCGQALTGSDPQPLRRQLWELPEIKPLVTEYQLHRLTCPCCATSTCGELPPGVPQGQAGPRLVALTALLMGCFKQSKRRVALFLEQVLNQPCSPGWVVKLQDQATAALGPAYAELARRLPDEAVLGIDESPTKQAGGKAWLWTFVARAYTVFVLRTTRAATVLEELLTDAFDGVVNCDRAKMYGNQGRLQWCWAHLKRDFQALVDHPDRQVQRLGRDLLRPTRELFRHWSRSLRRHAQPAGLVATPGADPPGDRGLAAARSVQRPSQAGPDVQAALRPADPAVDLPGGRRGRAHEQRQRTRPTAGGDLAKTVVRHPERPRQPLRGDDPDRGGNLPTTVPEQLRIPHRRPPGPLRRPPTPIAPPRGVNGYPAERLPE